MDIPDILHLYKSGFQCDAAMALDKKKKIIIVTHYMLKIIKRDSMTTLKREKNFLSNLEYQTNLVEPINLTWLWKVGLNYN